MTNQEKLDCGFDADLYRGKYYSVKSTARRLTADEQARIVAAIAHGGEAREHAVSALAVANGKPVSKVWIISDPVAALIERAERAMT